MIISIVKVLLSYWLRRWLNLYSNINIYRRIVELIQRNTEEIDLCEYKNFRKLLSVISLYFLTRD